MQTFISSEPNRRFFVSLAVNATGETSQVPMLRAIKMRHPVVSIHVVWLWVKKKTLEELQVAGSIFPFTKKVFGLPCLTIIAI